MFYTAFLIYLVDRLNFAYVSIEVLFLSIASKIL